MTLGAVCKKKSLKAHRVLHLAYGYMVIFVAVLFFKNASAAAQWITRGLSLCASKLIPSLFPFMVLSSLVVDSGAGAGFFKLLARPVHFLFGIGEDAVSPLILGWVCGFPVGAKCACELLKQEKITKREYNTLLCICATPSPAFLIGTVGAGMLGNTKVGTALYFISIGASSLIGIFLNVLYGKAPRKKNPPRRQVLAPNFSVSFTRAVRDAAIGMLNICAFVVFFSAFLGVLEGMLVTLGASAVLTSVIFGFFELTSGLAQISRGAAPSLVLCAMTVGWSGLSVHFQTISICAGAKCSFMPYFISQFAKALLCTLISFMVFR